MIAIYESQLEDEYSRRETEYFEILKKASTKKLFNLNQNQVNQLNIIENKWSGKRDSNSRPRPWQGRALPTELFPQNGVPKGSRTPVTAVKGQCPRPLDDGDLENLQQRSLPKWGAF
jgi:hypothetical protein